MHKQAPAPALDRDGEGVPRPVEGRVPAESSTVIPVVEEELEVSRREVETGRVRVTKKVHERQQVVDEPSWAEEVTVERVPVGEIIDAPPPVRYEGDTMIVPVLEEELLVVKRLVLKEVLRITRRRHERREPLEVTLRAEEATVERVAPEEDAGVESKGSGR